VTVDKIERIRSGVRNFDLMIDGGIPVYSVNIITGAPGSGKTIFAQQILFSAADPEHPAIFFTTLSEPSVKMIRYQRNFDFFAPSKINSSVYFFDLGDIIRNEGLARTIEVIINYVKTYSPRFITIDSFKAIYDLASSPMEVRKFGYDLAVELSTWECTTFLVGEYTMHEVETEPIFAIADGVIHMNYLPHGLQRLRYIEVLKMRGTNTFGGKHSFTIDREGVTVYPRITGPTTELMDSYEISMRRISSGVSELDKMLDSGFLEGSATLIVGGAGTGKTLLGLHFICEGAKQGEPGVIVTFQESPSQLVAIARSFGWDLLKMEQDQLLRIIYLSPVELNPDQHAANVRAIVAAIKAKRVLIDSLMDLEASIDDKSRYRDYVSAIVNFFRARGVTSILTDEVPELFALAKLSSYGVSYLSDNVILLRYVEHGPEVDRTIGVLKMRSSAHSKEHRRYQITSQGVEIMASVSHPHP
jgi:circadian clock protein KaiC